MYLHLNYPKEPNLYIEIGKMIYLKQGWEFVIAQAGLLDPIFFKTTVT